MPILDPNRPPSGTNRQHWHDIIFEADTRAGKTFDVLLLIFIGLSVSIIMLESVEDFRARHQNFLRIAEWFFTIVFTLEYVVRIYISECKRSYIFSFFGAIDFLSILPTYLALFFTGTHYLAVIRVLRMLRMFRVLKMIRHVKEGDILLRALVASRAKVTVFLIGVICLITIMGTLMYLIEGPEHGFTNIPVSIYWAVVTITTVGFGDITPQTPPGQLVAAIIMIAGYAIIAVPTGIVGAEIYSEAQTRIARRAERTCKSCACPGHEDDAKFCRECGAKLG